MSVKPKHHCGGLRNWLFPWSVVYQRAWLSRDLIAGIALGVVMISQGITFAVAEPNGRMQESLQHAGIEAAIRADRIFLSVDAAMKAYLEAFPSAIVQRGTQPSST